MKASWVLVQPMGRAVGECIGGIVCLRGGSFDSVCLGGWSDGSIRRWDGMDEGLD